MKKDYSNKEILEKENKMLIEKNSRLKDTIIEREILIDAYRLVMKDILSNNFYKET